MCVIRFLEYNVEIKIIFETQILREIDFRKFSALKIAILTVFL